MYSSESVVQCPHINSDHSCSWTTSSHPPYLPFRKTLQMLLVTRNHFGNYSQVFDVHNFRIIKAPKVQKLTVESITSTSISLSWALPVALDYGQDFSGDDDLPHVLYEVRVSHLNQYPNGLGSMGEDAYAFPPPQKGKSSLFRTNSTFYNFIHLIPFQTYRFSIRYGSLNVYICLSVLILFFIVILTGALSMKLSSTIYMTLNFIGPIGFI